MFVTFNTFYYPYKILIKKKYVRVIETINDKKITLLRRKKSDVKFKFIF